MSFNPGGSSSSIASQSDVVLNNPATGDVLTYNASQSEWENQLPPAAPVSSVAGKTGAVTLAEADVANLTTDLAAKASAATTITAGTGLTGGGSLSANRTLSANFGTATGTVAQGNDSRFTTTPTTSQTASYTLALGDAGGFVQLNSASAITLTVPPNSSVAFPVGTVISGMQYGAGQATIAAGAGVTLRTSSSLTTRAKYSTFSVSQIAANEWVVSGDLT